MVQSNPLEGRQGVEVLGGGGGDALQGKGGVGSRRAWLPPEDAEARTVLCAGDAKRRGHSLVMKYRNTVVGIHVVLVHIVR